MSDKYNRTQDHMIHDLKPKELKGRSELPGWAVGVIAAIGFAVVVTIAAAIVSR